jgi:hypothetical protein
LLCASEMHGGWFRSSLSFHEMKYTLEERV